MYATSGGSKEREFAPSVARGKPIVGWKKTPVGEVYQHLLQSTIEGRREGTSSVGKVKKACSEGWRLQSAKTGL